MNDQMEMLRMLQAAGGLPPQAGMVPPGPPPGTPPPIPPPGTPPVGPSMASPLAGARAAGGAPQGQLIPAPNSVGGLTPAQAQLLEAVAADPIVVETFLNVLAAAKQQGGQPGAGAIAPAGALPAPNPPIEQQLFG